MDLYIILGLEHGATDVGDQARATDASPGGFTRTSTRATGRRQRASARFSEAYETLIDPERRSRYDSGTPVGGGGGDRRTTGFEGFDFSGRGADHAADLRRSVRGRLHRRAAQQRTRRRSAASTSITRWRSRLTRRSAARCAPSP